MMVPIHFGANMVGNVRRLFRVRITSATACQGLLESIASILGCPVAEFFVSIRLNVWLKMAFVSAHLIGKEVLIAPSLQSPKQVNPLLSPHLSVNVVHFARLYLYIDCLITNV